MNFAEFARKKGSKDKRKRLLHNMAIGAGVGTAIGLGGLGINAGLKHLTNKNMITRNSDNWFKQAKEIFPNVTKSEYLDAESKYLNKQKNEIINTAQNKALRYGLTGAGLGVISGVGVEGLQRRRESKGKYYFNK